jgi:hypothetical protein
MGVLFGMQFLVWTALVCGEILLPLPLELLFVPLVIAVLIGGIVGGLLVRPRSGC